MAEEATKAEEVATKEETIKDGDGDSAVKDDNKDEQATKPDDKPAEESANKDEAAGDDDNAGDDSKETENKLPASVAPDLTANAEDATQTKNFQFF